MKSKFLNSKYIALMLYIYIGSIQPKAVHPLPNAKDVYLLPCPLPCSFSSWGQSPGSSMIVAVIKPYFPYLKLGILYFWTGYTTQILRRSKIRLSLTFYIQEGEGRMEKSHFLLDIKIINHLVVLWTFKNKSKY